MRRSFKKGKDFLNKFSTANSASNNVCDQASCDLMASGQGTGDRHQTVSLLIHLGVRFCGPQCCRMQRRKKSLWRSIHVFKLIDFLALFSWLCQGRGESLFSVLFNVYPAKEPPLREDESKFWISPLLLSDWAFPLGFHVISSFQSSDYCCCCKSFHSVHNFFTRRNFLPTFLSLHLLPSPQVKPEATIWGVTVTGIEWSQLLYQHWVIWHAFRGKSPLRAILHKLLGKCFKDFRLKWLTHDEEEQTNTIRELNSLFFALRCFFSHFLLSVGGFQRILPRGRDEESYFSSLKRRRKAFL